MKKIVDVSLKSRYPLLEKRRDTMEVKRIDTADAEMKQQKVKNVCAYCRVSTNIPHQKGSYESQLEYYENMIRSKADWNFAGIYADYGKSGTKEKGRTDFMRMLEDCDSGEIDIICTKSISRFARNTVECIQVVRKLKEMHIDVYFEKERIHTLSEKSELLLSIYSSVAQAESESISSNQKWSIQKRFLNGTYILPNPAYGYYTNENGLLEMDQKRAVVVRYIFDEYLDGKGVWLIAKSLNEQKIPTKTGKAAWLGGAIYIILKNSIYTGDLLLQKTYSEDTVPFVRRKNHGEYRQVLIENDHEPIVTHEEYEIVQRMLKQKSNRTKENREEQPEEISEFKGKVICGICGSSYNRQVKKGRTGKSNITWSCARRIQTKDLCENDIIKESQLEQAFVIMWNKLSNHCDEILVPLMNELEQLQATPMSQEQLERLEKQIQEQKKQREILNHLASGELIDSAFYMEQQNIISKNLKEYQRAKEQCLRKSRQRKELIQTKELIGKIKKGPQYLEVYDKTLFQAIVKKIIVNPNELVFQLKNGLQLTERGEKI
jgi:site-specific DNA recombinase